MGSTRTAGASRTSIVAVFGGSEPRPGSHEYDLAYQVGRLLAGAGFTVINGGYGGVMEASARGAREAGGSTIGVTTASFRDRGGANAFIDTEWNEVDLFMRTKRLIESARAYIVLPGRAGTLAELTFLWALKRSGLLGPRPVILVGPIWADLLAELRRLELLRAAEMDGTIVVSGPEEAVEAARRSLDATAARC